MRTNRSSAAMKVRMRGDSPFYKKNEDNALDLLLKQDEIYEGIGYATVIARGDPAFCGDGQFFRRQAGETDFSWGSKNSLHADSARGQVSSRIC